MTRARVKTLHDKVNSLLSMCDLDTPLNGLLFHSDTLCVLRYKLHEDTPPGDEDGQGLSQEDTTPNYGDGQEVIREEGEEKAEQSLAGTTRIPRPVLPPSRQTVLMSQPP